MLLGTRRGGRSPCSETLANDHLLLRKREERSFGVIAVGNVVLFNSNEFRNMVGMSFSKIVRLRQHCTISTLSHTTPYSTIIEVYYPGRLPRQIDRRGSDGLEPSEIFLSDGNSSSTNGACTLLPTPRIITPSSDFVSRLYRLQGWSWSGSPRLLNGGIIVPRGFLPV